MSYYIKARIKQIQLAIGEVIRESRQEVRSSSVLVNVEVAREHDKLYQRFYNWLRRVKHYNIEHEKARLCAQTKEHAVEIAVVRLLRIKMPQGSAHRKVKALIDAVNQARSRLKEVRAEHGLFSKRVG